jgi:hypothetical protein
MYQSETNLVLVYRNRRELQLTLHKLQIRHQLIMIAHTGTSYSNISLNTNNQYLVRSFQSMNIYRDDPDFEKKDFFS